MYCHASGITTPLVNDLRRVESVDLVQWLPWLLGAALDDELPADAVLVIVEGSGDMALNATLTSDPSVAQGDVVGIAISPSCARFLGGSSIQQGKASV